MKSFSLLGFLAAVVSSAVLTGATTPRAQEPPKRPVHFGRALPYPLPSQSSSVPITSTARVPMVATETVVPAIAVINEEGQAVGFRHLDTSVVRDTRYLSSYLESMHFEPGLIDGVPTSMQIRVDIVYFPAAESPIVIYPVDKYLRPNSHELYFGSMELNGIRLPTLVDFPRFSCYFPGGDSVAILPVGLYEVELDSGGVPTDARVVLENKSIPSQQMISALHWSKFKPAMIGDQSVASRCLVSIACFPRMSYPQKPFSATADSSRNLQREWQIRVWCDTIGYILPAIPKRAASDELTMNSTAPGRTSIVALSMRVDTLGQAVMIRCSPFSPANRDFVRQFMKELRFYPAVDFSGRPVPFDGLVELDARSAPIVRVSYFW